MTGEAVIIMLNPSPTFKMSSPITAMSMSGQRWTSPVYAEARPADHAKLFHDPDVGIVEVAE